MIWTRFTWRRIGPVVGFSEHGSNPLGYVKMRGIS